MCTTPKEHTMKRERETLRTANQNKTTRRAGYKQVYDPKEAFIVKGALWNGEKKKNINNNS